MSIGLVSLILVILLLTRVPVAFSLLLACSVYVLVDDSITMAISLQRITALLNSFPLLAVPLFILVGYLANAAGMAYKLMQALQVIFGQVRGSLGYVNVTSSLVFSWMSGSATADVGAMGSVMISNMKRLGYDPKFAAGLTGAASMIGPVMPPSIAAVLFAVLAGVSTGAVLIAGVIPALVLFAALCLYVYIYARKRPHLRGEVRPNRREVLRAIGVSAPILVTPVIMLGGILFGVFTPTEAAGVAVAYLLLFSMCAKWIRPRDVYVAFAKAAQTTGRIMIIAAAGGLFAYVLAREGAAASIADAIRSVSDSPIIFLLIVNVALLLLGLFLEPAAALLIAVPIVMPVALDYGVDPLQLGVIMILNLSIGLLTPPIGLVLFILAEVGGLSFQDVVRGVLPALGPLLLVLLAVTYIPAISTTLPNLMR